MIFNLKSGRESGHSGTRLRLNQDEFADICGIHRAYVGKIENGRFDLRVKTLHKIAHALKTNLAGLLKGID